ncbi:hypothetical protein JXL21_07290 [Candidatus Bathyarchaeota archaeon]|nr:hypothetical protein [Candidatus Bathyarchaeota archaeon]
MTSMIRGESKKILTFGVIIASLFAGMGMGVFGVLTASKTLSSSGSIMGINVGVYSDLACTTPISSLDWGTPDPGDTVIRTIYVKNEGNAEMTLSMSANTWVPSGVDAYLTVSWDQESTVLSEDEVVGATVTLEVSSGITGVNDFSFQIVVEGTG